MYQGSAPSLFSELAFDFDNNLFYLEEDEKNSALGFGFVFSPIQGGDVLVAEKLNVLLNQSIPEGSLMQFSLYSSPDIHFQTGRLLELRKNATGVMREFIKSKVKYLHDSTEIPLDTSTETKLRNINCILTFKIPITLPLSKQTVESVNKLRLNSKQILKTVGFHPVDLDADTHIRMMSTLFNWKEDAEWKRTKRGSHYDKSQIICDQIMDISASLEIYKDGLNVSGKHIKVLSPKRFPEFVTIGMAMSYAGDIRSGTRGIKDPFLITGSIYFDSPEKIKQKVEKKRQWITKQAHGPILDFVPHLATQKHDMDDLFELINKGDRTCKFMLTFAVFCDTEGLASTASANMKAYFQELGFTLMEDEHFCKSIFLNMLPFGGDTKLVRDIVRYKTLATSHIVRMLPVMGEWKGTGTPVMQFVSRTGQLMNNHLYDSGTNYNLIIAAQSGSGKSFLTNDIIMSYLSIGAKVWVIDVGKSYLKLSEAIDGSFIEFASESNICLNPFDIIKDYNEESDVIIGLLSNMAAQKDPLTDLQDQVLRKVLKQQWDIHGTSLTVDIIANTLLKSEDQRIRDVGNQLYSFTSKGEYGKYFYGKNNANLENPFTVLELEELKGRKHLQQVVLLQLISQIQQEMYLGERSRPKLLIIDEAWSLLTNGAVGKFIEDSYRRVRKYGGSAIVVTQSVNDLYNSAGGQAIAENSANMYLLRQKSEVIDSLKTQKKLPLSDSGYDLVKSVHTNPGQYSEIFFITEMGAGIGRLYVNRFSQLLYSTKADEVHALDVIAKELNCGIEDSIVEYIRREEDLNQ